MSKLVGLWSMIALCWIVVTLGACNKDDEPQNPQMFIEKSWKLDAAGFVKQDGVDVSADYQGLTVTFNKNGTYTTSNAKKLFFPTGTWNWPSANTTQVILDGDHTFTVKAISKTVLHVEFTMAVEDVNPNGKAEAVVGSYEMKLTGV